MVSVTALEAKTRFGKLLTRVAKGEEIVITKHDKPVARLVPEGQGDLTRFSTAASQFRQIRDRISARTKGRSKISLADWKSAVSEGRK